MQRSLIVALAVLVLGTAAFAAAPGFMKDFGMVKSDLAATGANPYFILKPGYQLFLKGGGTELTITVLKETKLVDGVTTRIVEEREKHGGKLVEVSRNYFAISKKNKDVFYFGEDVDMYDKNEHVSGHGGSWHAGVGGAKAGLMMPGSPRLGMKYYQEVAPKMAMDRAEIVSMSEVMKTPAGEFSKVLKTEETTPLEPGAKEYKYHFAGIGLLKDGEVVLVRHGYVK